VVGRVLLVAMFAALCLTGLVDEVGADEGSASLRSSSATLTATPTDVAPVPVGRASVGAPTFDQHRDASSTGPMALLGLVPIVALAVVQVVRKSAEAKGGRPSLGRLFASRAPPVARLT